MPKKDLQQFEALLDAYNVTDLKTRYEFSEYLHTEKRQGRRGSKPNGDFTWQELCQLLEDFLRPQQNE